MAGRLIFIITMHWNTLLKYYFSACIKCYKCSIIYLFSKRGIFNLLPLCVYVVIIDNTACLPAKSLQSVWLFAILWTVTHQAPLSMGFSRQESQSGLPFPSPVDLPIPGSEPRLLRLLHCRQILYRWATGKAPEPHYLVQILALLFDVSGPQFLQLFTRGL